LNQSTHSAVANSTCSTLRQGFRGLISSVLYNPLMVSAKEVSAADGTERGLNPGFSQPLAEPDREVY
jgi:hypothetical protein